MRVQLLGTGAADGWPNPWCSCASCSWARAVPSRVRTHTAALVDERLLIDCGSDVPRQASRAGVSLAGLEAVLLTHGHWDHADGAALLTRSWAGLGSPLQVLGPESALARVREWVGAHDPVELIPLAPGDTARVAGLTVRALPAAHGDEVLAAGALLYDVAAPEGGRLLYATDTGPLQAAALDLLGERYHLVLLEETFGAVTDHGTGHLDLASFPEQLAELRRRGAVDAGTDVIAVHLGHHNPPTPELTEVLSGWGARVVPDLTTFTLPAVAPGAPRTPEPTGPQRTLLLGGARSGKSVLAERLLAAEPAVTYIATGRSRPEDPEWAGRVAAHRARRPAGWATTETTDLAAALRASGPGEPVLVDCLTLWLTAVLDDTGAWQGDATAEAAAERRVADLIAAIRSARCRLVLVSNEVGSGVVPAHRSGRLFRDLLGDLNARVGAECEQVTLVVAGRAVPLASGETAIDRAGSDARELPVR